MGRRMRAAVALVAALLGVALVALPAAAAAAQPLRPDAGHSAFRPSSVEDFSFASWHSDFRLGLTPEGRSRLTTTETIVADFPQIDQNHGIRRAIPTHYDGHPTALTIESVTDGEGHALDFETDDDSTNGGDVLVVTIAAEGFVHGRHTYVITYTQQNVTLYPDDSDDEEFFWQVNGTGWAQPFGSVTATLHVDPELAPRLTGRIACIQGAADSTDSCDDITSRTVGGGVVVDATAADLAPHDGLAIVVGFTPGTFVPRDDSFAANPAPGISLAGAIAALVAAVIAGIARLTRWRNAPGRGTVIPEYLPPKGVNLLTAGNISGTSSRSIPAQFLSFAVRGNVRVLQEGEDRYLLELRHLDGVDDTERSILTHLFPDTEPGSLRDLSVASEGLTTSMQGQLRLVPQQMLEAGLRVRRASRLRAVVIGLAVAGALVGLFASLVAFATQVGGTWPALTLFLAIGACVVTFVFASAVRPLTASGAELRDYLKGLKWYIELAEADRLRVLQSPAGALRSPYRPDDGAPGTGRLQIVKLYERVLPYAVLFGEEKKWVDMLGEYYAETGSEPDWYLGSGGFSAAYFAAGISAFSSSTTSAWAGSTASSTSSGFGGGAVVGGGGGGGGGGGV
ncbi:DUF2207 family protein [Cryobacterium tepidiphilum]|uniref:DUF2207 domain-containing protein n=1 Tax=Cryobacterium tepidiphilum TaxID=2486026 RepID=A0A3M8LBX5_9MICO|nr:DUF2207 domain-containing protein [Cryobacterium tepidiphilum]RNE62449.1 DUF2207 domain-containing protein [Cryobacterium tepidiphilum]